MINDGRPYICFHKNNIFVVRKCGDGARRIQANAW